MANEKIPDLGFHHIALQVKDFERERAFLEALGMKRSRESLGAADVVLWLLDASEPAETLRARLDEMERARSQTHAKFIPCWNKMDASALDRESLARAAAADDASDDDESDAE